ncbi:MAG TPA: alkaline shock response membrane anchor protein AmaP [Streptosporangiaceae bacterium]
MHADRTNRTMMVLFGLLLIAVGLDAGAASIGAYGTHTQHSLLMANPTGHFIGSNGAWLWPVAAVAALIIALLALRWLLALLFSTDRSGDLVIRSSSGAGRTTLANGALTDAVVGEIEGYRGVNSARARLIGDAEDPELVVTAGLEESADFTALRQRIETEALTHARQALGNMALPTQLDLTISTKKASRVT